MLYETTSFPRRKSLRRFPRRRRKFRNISAVILRRSFPRLNRSVILSLQNTTITLSRYHLCRARRKYHVIIHNRCALHLTGRFIRSDMFPRDDDITIRGISCAFNESDAQTRRHTPYFFYYFTPKRTCSVLERIIALLLNIMFFILCLFFLSDPLPLCRAAVRRGNLKFSGKTDRTKTYIHVYLL
jgi:hypothetical protein